MKYKCVWGGEGGDDSIACILELLREKSIILLNIYNILFLDIFSFKSSPPYLVFSRKDIIIPSTVNLILWLSISI